MMCVIAVQLRRLISESARSDWRHIQIQDGRWQCTIVLKKICVENHTMTVSNIRSLAVPRISPSNFCYVRDLDSIFAEI